MGDKKRLPLYTRGGTGKGPMVTLATRVLIVVALDFLAVTVVVLAKQGVAPSVVPTLVIGYAVTGAIVGLVNYLFWRPQYDKAA